MVLWLLAMAGAAPAQLFINEILFNPPGTDTPNEYIELRGPPNAVLPAGTYFVAVNGDAGSGPGSPQNIFDLSGQAVGGNGFLVLLQKGTPYAANSNATILVNTNGAGWGSGAGSSLGHRGAGGQTELQNASVTFFLIQTTNPPAFSDDIDPGNTGVPHGPVWDGWTVLDSVGVLDNDGAGDFAYGAINFRRNAGASATGTVVPVGYTPGYVGRTTNSTGSAAGDWVASDNLVGSAPNWWLGSSAYTVPASFANLPLNHLGGPNFGAAAFNGVVAVPSGGSTVVVEGGATDSYKLGLNTSPAGNVTVQVSTGSALQITTNGTAWTNSLAVVFSNTNQTTLTVRAPADNVVDTSPHWAVIHHAITNTADAARYPTSALGPLVNVAIEEKDSLLLSELKVNPPGSDDAPWEFVEIKGPPNALLTNIYFLAVEGSATKNPGTVNLAVNLTSARLGSSGLLVIGATNNPYSIPASATLFGDGRFNQPGTTLPNGVQSFLLVSSPQPFVEGADLDAGNNGFLEGLPAGTTILDGVAFADGDTNDVFYTSAVLALPTATPDAAIRFPTNATPQAPAAWCYGLLAGASGGSLVFDSANLSTNFPVGALLTPGQANDVSLTITGVGPLSGVIGDPTNPGLTFTVADANSTNAAALNATATSDVPAVVPSTNLTIIPGAGGVRTLYLNPVGVGFATITLTVSNAGRFGQVIFPYAASAMGHSNGLWHTGASDGSTAEAVDANYMFIGDDENQTLRLYDRRRSGPPLAQFDFMAELGLSGQEAGEVDIEGSTRVGNRLYWTGSHSHSNTGATRTNRTRFFATDLVGTGTNAQLTFAGYYAFLKTDLTNWDAGNGHGKGSNYYGLTASGSDNVNPKAPDGFNIEGLTMAPGSTNAAYLGFRAPIVPTTNRTYALIVPVLNFAALAASTNAPAGSAVFGTPIELDLYGRGIRSIEGTGTNFLISAGNPGDTKNNYPLDFKLYTWTGNPADQPQQRAADMSGTQPEGLVELPAFPWTTNSQVQVISDLGARIIYNDGVENKHALYPAFKKCRSDWVTFGAVVKPMPIILSSHRTATTLTVTWRALKGETYALQSSPSVHAPVWTDLPGDVTATGPFATKTVTTLPPTTCFYRLIVR